MCTNNQEAATSNGKRMKKMSPKVVSTASSAIHNKLSSHDNDDDGNFVTHFFCGTIFKQRRPDVGNDFERAAEVGISLNFSKRPNDVFRFYGEVLHRNYTTQRVVVYNNRRCVDKRFTVVFGNSV